MRRSRPALSLVALLLVACGSGEAPGDDPVVRAQPATSLAPATAAPATGACGLKPLTFVNERWQGASLAPPGGTGVLWEQAYTFTNPNGVDVRLATGAVHLRLTGSGGYFLKMARSTFRPVADDTVPAGKDQVRHAQAWLAAGNTPATEEFFASSTATVSGAECAVPVERLSTSPPPAHVLALPACDPQQAPSAC